MAIDVQTTGGTTGTAITAADYYYYSDVDPDVGTVDIEFTATGYTSASNLLWFYLSGDDGTGTADDPIDRPFAFNALTDVARTSIVDMSLSAESDLRTWFGTNSATTIMASFSGTDTVTVPWKLGDDIDSVGSPMAFFVAEYTDLESTPIGVLDSGFKPIIINTPSYININELQNASGDKTGDVYNGYRIADGTTLRIGSTNSEDWDVSTPANSDHLSWSIELDDTVVHTATGVNISYNFASANKIYTISATGESESSTQLESIEISTVANPGVCNSNKGGYIRHSREGTLNHNKISVGMLAGSNSRSINKFADYAITAGQEMTGTTSLGDTRDALIASNIVQNTSGISDDNNGLRFSEFFDLQAISGEVVFIGETPDRYGYYNTSNGAITVTVNCNTTKSSNVSVSVQGPRMSSPTTIVRSVAGGANQFRFTGLDTRGGGGADATEDWTISITDTTTSNTGSVIIENGPGVKGDLLGTTFT